MKSLRPKLSAHVALDYQFGDFRQFVFTPTASGKSHAAIVLNEHGQVTSHRSTPALFPHAAALTRWALIYFRRSIPAVIAIEVKP